MIDNIYTEIENIAKEIKKLVGISDGNPYVDYSTLDDDHYMIKIEWFHINMKLLFLLKKLRLYRKDNITQKSSPDVSLSKTNEICNNLSSLEYLVIDKKRISDEVYLQDDAGKWTASTCLYQTWLKDPVLVFFRTTPLFDEFEKRKDQSLLMLDRFIIFQEKGIVNNIESHNKINVSNYYTSNNTYVEQMPCLYDSVFDSIRNLKLQGVQYETRRLLLMLRDEILGLYQDQIVINNWNVGKIPEIKSERDKNIISEYVSLLCPSQQEKEFNNKTKIKELDPDINILFTRNAKRNPDKIIDNIKKTYQFIWEKEIVNNTNYKNYYLYAALRDAEVFVNNKEVELTGVARLFIKWNTYIYSPRNVRSQADERTKENSIAITLQNNKKKYDNDYSPICKWTKDNQIPLKILRIYKEIGKKG